MPANITDKTAIIPVYEDFSKSLTHRRPKPPTEMPTSRPNNSEQKLKDHYRR